MKRNLTLENLIGANFQVCLFVSCGKKHRLNFEDLFHSASDSQEAAVIISLEKICFICACSIFLVCRRSSTERACARFSWLFSSSFFLKEDVVFAQWEGSFERWTTDGHEHVEVVSFDYSRVLDFLSLVSAISRLSFASGLFLT